MAESPRPLKFSRAMRLKQGRDFARIRQQGQRMVTGCLIANWRRLPAGSGARLAVVTSSKIGNSAVRSRARRLLRETFRIHQHDFSEPIEIVLIARNSIVGKRRAVVERDFLATLRKAGLLSGEQASGSENNESETDKR